MKSEPAAKYERLMDTFRDEVACRKRYEAEVQAWRQMADRLAWRLDAHILMCDAIDDKSRSVYREYQKLCSEGHSPTPASDVPESAQFDGRDDAQTP